MKNMKKNNPYERFTDKELILRDQLAIDRTILANERTMLAYMRTGLALILSGAGCISLYTNPSGITVGGIFMVCGIVVAIAGLRRYDFMKKMIRTAEDTSPKTSVTDNCD
jgi:putative membrane protein